MLINQIEAALIGINDACFQEFCNHFLYFKNNPNVIEPIGSVIGKEKTRKGTPDCYLIDNEHKLIYVEYTTQRRVGASQSFFSKLKADVQKCFNSNNIGKHNRTISKVIQCFTDRLTIDERLELEQLCKSYNSFCSYESYGIRDLAYGVFDYPILGTLYLNITIGTGQLMELSEFVKFYEKSKFATPLHNKFIGRRLEIVEAQILLSQNDILIVTGSSGVGKSKFGIEICQQFCLENPTYKLFCIGNKELAIWDDLKTVLQNNNDYIIFIDDANRLSKNYQWIIYLLKENRSGKLKIVATVRDYALKQIETLSIDFDFTKLHLNEFSRNEINEILKCEEFNIHNPLYLDKIYMIAKGNIRLAIMCALIAKKSNNLIDLSDASQIYNEYFSTVFAEIELFNNSETWKVLGVISFFRVVNRENRQFNEKLFSLFNIKEETFWEICYKMHEYEIVNLFENQLVKISDQVLATYLFYKSFFDTKYLHISIILTHFIQEKKLINDSIIPVVNIFNFKKVKSELVPLLIEHWNKIENNNESALKFIDLFWFYLENHTLAYFNNLIESLPPPDTQNFRYTYEQNEFANNRNEILNLLANFRYFYNGSSISALKLSFQYVKKVPYRMAELIYILRTYYTFNRSSYLNDNYLQHTLLDFLIKEAQTESESSIYTKAFLAIAPTFLLTEHNEFESEGRQFHIYTIKIGLSDSIRLVRSKIFEFVFSKITSYKPEVVDFFQEYLSCARRADKEILEFDASVLLGKFENHFDSQQYLDCKLINEYLNLLEDSDINYDKTLEDRYTNDLLELHLVISPERHNRKSVLDWDNFDESKKRELEDYCTGYNFDDYVKLFDNIKLLKSHVMQRECWVFDQSVSVILSIIIEKNDGVFLDILGYILKCHDYPISPNYILNRFFKHNPECYIKTLSCLEMNCGKRKLDWLIGYHSEIPEELVRSNVNNNALNLYDHFLNTLRSIKQNYSFWNLLFYKKYDVYDSLFNIHFTVTSILIDKIEKEGYAISFGERFFTDSPSFFDNNYEIFEKAYLYSRKIENHFDYHGEVLANISSKDDAFLPRYFDFIYPQSTSLHDYDNQRFDFIWKVPNRNNLIICMIEYFAKKERFEFWDKLINIFFKNIVGNEDKAILVLEDIVTNFCTNELYMKTIFNILTYSMPTYRDRILQRFLVLNKDINMFKELELVRNGGVFHGSRVPYIEEDIDSWKTINQMIDGMNNDLAYMSHKAYIDERIIATENEKKWEIKREFEDES